MSDSSPHQHWEFPEDIQQAAFEWLRSEWGNKELETFDDLEDKWQRGEYFAYVHGAYNERKKPRAFRMLLDGSAEEIK